MTYDEAVGLSDALRESFDAPFSASDKSLIERLYDAVLGRRFQPTNCQQCYHDALIEIICFLKKEKRMAERSKYIMRAGFIIHSPLFDNGKIYSNDNLTDDVAERYLSMFPQKRPMFDLRPSDGQKTGGVVNVSPKRKKARKTKKNGK